MINSVIKALNDNQRLPKFLIVILDKDILDDLKSFEFGVEKEMAVILNWLTRQIDIVIRRKKLQIATAKPGALGPNGW